MTSGNYCTVSPKQLSISTIPTLDFLKEEYKCAHKKYLDCGYASKQRHYIVEHVVWRDEKRDWVCQMAHHELGCK